MGRRQWLHELLRHEREDLAGRIFAQLTNSFIDHHLGIDHGSSLLAAHRTYLGHLEAAITNAGGGMFVPLPKWDPATPIPIEFQRVRPRGSGAINNTDPNMPIPPELVWPSSCNLATLAAFTNQLNPWHGDVHGRVGGVMADIAISPAAVIFFVWHALLDDLWWEQERCSSRPSPALPTLGGVILDTPAIGRNSDGRLEIFAIGQDHGIWHIWQTAPNNGWSGWQRLGDLQVAVPGRPSIGVNHDGRMEVFVRGRDRAIWHIWQTSASNGWSGWDSIGGAWLSDPVVAANRDGRLEIFARGTDNVVSHRNQMWAGGNWSPGWEGLIEDGIGSQTLAVNADGRLEIFTRLQDGSVAFRWQTSPGGAWSPTTSLGGSGFGDPIVALNSDGRLEIFMLGTDNHLAIRWQTAANNGWSDRWYQFVPRQFPRHSKPAVIVNAHGGLEVFMRDSSGAIVHSWQTQSWPPWSDWHSLGGAVLSNPNVGVNLDGRLEVIARGADSSLVHRWQPW